MECGGINPVAPPRRKKKEARLLEIPQVDKSTGNLPSNAIHSKTASRCDIRGESPSTGSPNAGIYATVSKSVNGKLQSKGQIAESEPKSLHRPPVSSRAVRNSSSKEAENVKGSRNETFNGITSTEDANKEDGYAVPNSPIIPGKTALHSNASESPKKKPARPERPKRYVSKDASSKPAPHSPAPHSSGQHSPTATVLQAAYGSPVNSSILRSRAEGEFTIIDSRVKALERRASKDEEQVKGDILSPTRRTARPPTPPAKLSSYKEQIQKTPHEASIGSGIRSAAQTFISKIKASTLPRGLSSSGQTKSSHPPPEKPPRPAPPPSDRIYATVNRATDSESSPYSPIYSYISCDLKGNRNIANKSVSLPANTCLGDRTESDIYEPIDPKTVADRSNYATCFSSKVKDFVAAEEEIYVDMSGLSQSSSNLTADSSPSLPSHPPSISPVVTTKHLLPTESQDDDNDDYMFMSPLTTDAPSVYMKVRPPS